MSKGFVSAGWLSITPDDRMDAGNVLDGAFDPISEDVQEAALAVVKAFVPTASLGELVAMLGLAEEVSA